MNIRYITKLKLVSAVLTASLLIGICANMAKAGMIAVNSESAKEHGEMVARIKRDKASYSTVLGDICDRNDDLIMNSNDVIVKSSNEYDNAYTYVLGNIHFDTPGILNTQYDVLTDTSYSEDYDKGTGIRLTIDDTLQKSIYSMIEGKRKAVVVMEKESGRILAMVSSYEEPFSLSGNPSYEQLESYSKASQPVWLNEALNCYPSGSVMKVMTSAAAIDSGKGDFTVNDYGSVSFNGKTISDSYVADGSLVDILTAFIKSSNVYFSSIAVELGNEIMKDYVNRFLLNDRIVTDFGIINNRSLLKKKKNNDFAIGTFGYGQGGEFSTVTLCMIVQGALTGKIWQPHIISGTFCYDEDGEMEDLTETEEKVLSENIVSQETCKAVEQLMKASAEDKGLAEDVGVKSGTAEITLGNGIEGNRATMVGISQDKYIIAISEISEGTLYGSSHKELMRNITDLLREY